MKYILMCGDPTNERHLVKIKGEPLVARTIRQLEAEGVREIFISSVNSRMASYGKLLIHDNKRAYGLSGGYWLDAFYPMNEPVCYIFGDVVFTDEAIKKIVKTETNSIEFFASAPPFAKDYPKKHAEPFAFKVEDYELFNKSLEHAKRLQDEGKFMREPIAWELWQVIKGTTLNNIIYTNYIAINDSTCDIDEIKDAEYYNG